MTGRCATCIHHRVFGGNTAAPSECLRFATVVRRTPGVGGTLESRPGNRARLVPFGAPDGQHVYLFTDADFGCVQWEER